MSAGKIKIKLDNLDDAEGVVSEQEEAGKETTTKSKKSSSSSKKNTPKEEAGEKKTKKKRGRPPKKKSKDEEDLEKKIEQAGNDFMSRIDAPESKKVEVMKEIEKGNGEETSEDFRDNDEENAKKEDGKEVEEKDNPLKFGSVAEKNAAPEVVEEDEEENPDSARRSVGLYKKIAIFFLVATFLLLLVIFYFLFASVTITIVPDQERKSSNMIIDIYDKDSEDIFEGEKIAGIVKKSSTDLTEVYQTSGEDVIGEQVSGEVTIYNYYSKNQPLVATTRLMSPDGRVYRIEETVNVPAGGEVEVMVYADDPSINMEIGPTKFTIPGLWAGLQDQIYAESEGKIEYSQRVDKFVTQGDIDNAVRDLKQQLVKKAKTEINERYKDYSQVIYSIDDNTVFTEVDVERGDEVDEFEATITANIVAVAFDGESAANLAEKKFTSTLPAEKELIEFDKNNIIYSLDSFDYREGTASINATFEGKVSLGSNSDVVQKENILGLNNDQLNDYLMNKEGISGYDVEFFPTFIKRVPDIPDKIIIKTRR